MDLSQPVNELIQKNLVENTPNEALWAQRMTNYENFVNKDEFHVPDYPTNQNNYNAEYAHEALPDNIFYEQRETSGAQQLVQFRPSQHSKVHQSNGQPNSLYSDSNQVASLVYNAGQSYDPTSQFQSGAQQLVQFPPQDSQVYHSNGQPNSLYTDSNQVASLIYNEGGSYNPTSQFQSGHGDQSGPGDHFGGFVNGSMTNRNYEQGVISGTINTYSKDNI